MSEPTPSVLPFRISVLIFLQNQEGKELLLCRRKSPNRGCWSPIGGKLRMDRGESPCECAIRETAEEVGLNIGTGDLHLFAMISERAYEGTGHWLMFLYTCRTTLNQLPAAIDEGEFGFFAREEIDGLRIPETDRTALWPLYDRHRNGFVALRADCTPGSPPNVIIEEKF
jgi:8-oxo-dGTP diphosphatase